MGSLCGATRFPLLPRNSHRAEQHLTELRVRGGSNPSSNLARIANKRPNNRIPAHKL